MNVGLIGCGGGGGAGSPTGNSSDSVSEPTVGPVGEAANYIPNYVPHLTATRQWDKNIVRVRVNSPDNSPLVQQAIELWRQKVGHNISFQVVAGDPPNEAVDVTIGWVAAGTLPTDSIGRTTIQYRTSDQTLTSAQISIEQSLPDNFQVQVIAHELGHALGIDGHSRDMTDLMYTNAHLPAIVTPSDQNTVLWSYEASETAGSRSVGSTADATAETASVEYICGRGE